MQPMNWRSNKLSSFKIIVFNSFLVAILLCGCHSEENSDGKKMEQKQAAAVPATEVFSLEKGRFSSSLQIPGELMAYKQVDLYAKENNFVKKLYVDVGSEVTSGQLLVTMEAPELGSQLAGAQSNIKSHEAIFMASKA